VSKSGPASTHEARHAASAARASASAKNAGHRARMGRTLYHERLHARVRVR
jgi:hypothetical protein